MKTEKVEKLAANLYKKTEYVTNTINLKEAFNLVLVLKKMHRVIRFYQKSWVKPYINIETDLRKAEKIILKNIFLSWWVIQFFEKLWKMFKNIETLNLLQ